LATLVLLATTVIVAALGVIVAIVTIFGYREIRRRAIISAEIAARAKAEETVRMHLAQPAFMEQIEILVSRTAREHLKNALVVSVLGEERVSPDDAREPRFPGTPAKDEWRDDAPP